MGNVAEYAKRFGVKRTSVVASWIRRGIIPLEDIILVSELNDIQLIKAVAHPGAELGS